MSYNDLKFKLPKILVSLRSDVLYEYTGSIIGQSKVPLK